MQRPCWETPPWSVSRRHNDGDCGRADCTFIITGAFIYAFIIGSFTAMIESLTKDKSEFDMKMRGMMKMLQVLCWSLRCLLLEPFSTLPPAT